MESTYGDVDQRFTIQSISKVDLYFRMCSLSVNARSLAGFGLILVNSGVNPYSGRRILDKRVARTVKTLMLTCGMYNGSGKFAVRVGIPSRSGIDGGIMASVDKRMGIGTTPPITLTLTKKR